MRKVEKSQVEKSPQNENSLDGIDSATNKLPTVKVSWKAKRVLDGIQNEATQAGQKKPKQWDVVDTWLAAYELVQGGSFPKAATINLNYDALWAKAVEARNRAVHSGGAPEIVSLHGKIEEMLLALNRYFTPGSPPDDSQPEPKGRPATAKKGTPRKRSGRD